MTEKELRKLFCKNGEITDCSLKYTPEGVFRKFAFVGYKTEEEAKSAVKNLNNSFINTSKVEVSFANDLHDSSNKLRPWSKHSKQNKSTKTSTKEGGQTDKVECGPSWSLKMTGLPPGVKLADIVEFFNPIPCKVLFPQSGKAFTKVNVSFESEEKRDEAMRRNKNYIGAKKIFLHKTTVTEVQEQHPVRERVVTTDSNDAEVIAETGRLFLRNLAYCCKEEDIETLFGKFGPLEVHLPIDKFTKKPKGFGFVEFILPENALTAYQNLDGTIFQGRMLHIVGGQAKKDELENIDDLPFAKKKELLKKKSASNSKNWNTLFVGADAVAAVMAQKFGTTKHDLLLEDGKQSAAVRLALGQTQIVGDTRQFLLDNGISLDSFSQASAERSKTVFLVKHLPAGTTTEQLQPVFAPFGEIKRLLLAPYGLTAIIEFAEPTEARSAYRSLAYTKFLHVPLYLEWAPVDVFLQRSEEIAEKSKADDSTNVPETNQLENDSSSESDVDEDEPGRTIFVKNLSIVTTEDELKEIFSKCGKVRSVNLTKSKKEDPTEGTCFGFVEFTTSSSAEEAIRQLQRSTINSKQIELKISDRIIKKQPKEKKKSLKSKQKVTTKILIRNVPFQATQKDITILFSADTGVKSIRLPKKLSGTGSHRGFAFVEFLTKHDAKRAFNRLCHNTALYGRRLDLEWATTEADQSDLTDQVSQIRKRTASRYHPEDTVKKHKKSELLEELKISG